SSSDGQFFQAAGAGRAAANLNTHYGHEPGFKAYTHLSDRYSPFYTKLIAVTASEALHVLDALLYHQSEVATGRHHTDGGGDSDHVFALCSAHPGPEASAPLQLRQAVRLSRAGADDCRP